MREIRGILHDGRTSRSHAACLRIYADGSVWLVREAGEQALALDALGIPPRLGNTPRRIALPDGGEFESADNDGIDAVLKGAGRGHRNWLHRLESRLGAVVFATALVLVAGAVFTVRGVPALAREAAFALPPELDAKLSEGTLELLDRSLGATELGAQRQEELRARFERVARHARLERHARQAPSQPLALLFRGGGPLGANAFALPDGSVVVTDELVALAEDDDEIEAVMAHEAGHVVYRHGLREAIQSSVLALGILLISGDLSSTSGFVATLPTLLAESRFSRDFEREADDYAVAYLEEQGIEPERLGRLLRRLEEAGGGVEIPFLSSHPSTEERIERLGAAAP